MITGIFIGLGIAAIIWLSWYLAPLGLHKCDHIGTPLREGRERSQVKRYGSNGPPPCPKPPPRKQ